jgi:hypothetical protein
MRKVAGDHGDRGRHRHGSGRGAHLGGRRQHAVYQKITVSQDADCLAGDDVNGPLSAYCQAMVINKHTLEITGGKTHAELDKADPNRATAMDSARRRCSRRSSRSASP